MTGTMAVACQTELVRLSISPCHHMIHGRLLKSSSINNMYYCKENERRVSSNSNSIINLNYIVLLLIIVRKEVLK